MRALSSLILEMERQGKRLSGLLRAGRLNTMTLAEFREMVAILDRLKVNCSDFRVARWATREKKAERQKRLR